MNPTLGGAALAAVIALAPAPTSLSGQSQGLRRLPPSPPAPTAPRTPTNNGEQFQPEGWADRLKSGDLDRRQRAFDQIVDLSRRDEGALQWLRERAHDGKESDLAWTCRLALREVEHGNAGPNDPWGHGARSAPFPPDAFGRDGWVDSDRIRAEVERILEEMHRGMPAMPAMPSMPRMPAMPHGGNHAERREVTIQIDDQGAVVKVTTQADGGEEETQEYRADSLDEILREHPELQGDIGGIEIGPGQYGFHYGPQPGHDGVPTPQPRRLLPRPGTSPDAGGALRTDVLGVYVGELGDEEREQLGIDAGVGLRVQDVEPNSIASALGLRSGDTLVEVGGKPVAGRDEIGAALRARAADGELTATWIDAWGQRRTRTWRPAGPRGEGK